MFCAGLTSGAHAAEDYRGPLTTQVLYTMCSQNDRVSREKCDLYIQGLIYGLTMQKSLTEHSLGVCLPEMTPEEARLRILKFIDGVTAGKPSNNKDGGNWIALMGLSAGNLCKK